MAKDKIYVAYGNDGKESTLELLGRADPLAGLDRAIRIALKPNLVVPKPASMGATTHPEIAEAYKLSSGGTSNERAR